MQWIYPILVEAIALPLANDPTDLTGRKRWGMLQFVEHHMTQPIFPTRETWGTSATSVAAVAAMEAEMPLDPEALAYMEAQRAARQ